MQHYLIVAQVNSNSCEFYCVYQTTYLCSGVERVNTDMNACMEEKMVTEHTSKYLIFWYFPNSPTVFSISS